MDLDNKDLRKCLKMARLIHLLGTQLETVANRRKWEEGTGPIFRKLESYGSDARWGLVHAGDAVEAAEDLLNPNRHNPTKLFSQCRGE